MGVYAKELTRKSLWEAFKSRHVYATTGKRIILYVSCGKAIMGDEIIVNHFPTISVRVIGTFGLDKVELIRGLSEIYSHKILESGTQSNKIKIAWSGARVPTRRRNTDWGGYLTLDRGKILSVEEFAFDFSWEGVRKKTEKRIVWSSTTAGDQDGLILTLDAPDDACISVKTKPVEFSFQLKDLDESLVIDAGKLEQKVIVSRISDKDCPKEASFKFTDKEVKPGLNPYYVRVTQCDGEKAWSSPIFLNYKD